MKRPDDHLAHVLAIDEIGHGEVHYADCFIVTTRWPKLNWVAIEEPISCGFCVRRAHPAGFIRPIKDRRTTGAAQAAIDAAKAEVLAEVAAATESGE
jgi:hypothetical protein